MWMGAALPHSLEAFRAPSFRSELRIHLPLADAANAAVALMSPFGSHLRDELRGHDWDARCEHRNC